MGNYVLAETLDFSSAKPTRITRGWRLFNFELGCLCARTASNTNLCEFNSRDVVKSSFANSVFVYWQVVLNKQQFLRVCNTLGTLGREFSNHVMQNASVLQICELYLGVAAELDVETLIVGLEIDWVLLKRILNFVNDTILVFKDCEIQNSKNFIFGYRNNLC
jgi:hypothetical protein